MSQREASGIDISLSFEQAAENHLRDALRMSHAERWQWLREAMDFGFKIAKDRARQGLPTLDSHGMRFAGRQRDVPNGKSGAKQ